MSTIKRKQSRNKHANKRDKFYFNINKLRKRISFYLLCFLWIVRVLIVFCPQYGYIQPDEFFQSTEPIAGDVFQVENHRVWEFDVKFPLRSMFFPQLITKPAFYVIKYLFETSSICSYLLLVGPRLLITLATFLIDYSVYTIAMFYTSKNIKQDSFLLQELPLNCLLIHSSTYLSFTYYTHTFSNTVETILFGLLLVMVLRSLFNRKYILFTFISPNNIIGILMALGFFNRPTFALFASVPVLYWIFYYTNQKKEATLFFRILQNGLNLLSSFSITAMLLIVVDTEYHRGINFPTSFINWNNLQMDFIQPLASHLVLTPMNFLVYNLQAKNLSNHGLHPFYFHFLVNIPLMFTVLSVYFLLDIYQMAIRKKSIQLSNVNKNDSTPVISTLLLLTLLVSIIGFSLIPHQEPRFLLPLIIPFVCLYANQLVQYFNQEHLSATLLLFIWISFNCFLTYFYGYVHQAGTIKNLFYLNNNVNYNNSQITDLIFSRQYLPPRHLLNIPQALTSGDGSNLVRIHDLSIEDFHQPLLNVLRKIYVDHRRLSDNQLSHRIFLSMPRCYEAQLHSMHSSDLNFTTELLNNNFPHFSGEDLSVSLNNIRQTKLIASKIFNNVYSAFSMGVWQLKFH